MTPRTREIREKQAYLTTFFLGADVIIDYSQAAFHFGDFKPDEVLEAIISSGRFHKGILETIDDVNLVAYVRERIGLEEGVILRDPEKPDDIVINRPAPEAWRGEPEYLDAMHEIEKEVNNNPKGWILERLT